MLFVFLLGVIVGALVLFGLLCWWAGSEVSAFAAERAKQDLADIERQTIQRLMAVELGARRAARTTHAPGTDVIDSTATHVEPSP